MGEGAGFVRFVHAWKRIARLQRSGLKVVDRSPPRMLGARPAVAPARTWFLTDWFLTDGWRMHGLLDPNEIPGVSGA